MKHHSVSQIDEIIETIKSRYEIGQKILKECGKSSPPNLIQKLADEHGINRDTAQKLRAIADPGVGYTKPELGRLYRQFYKHRYALTITHFTKLISIEKGKRRNQLTQEAMKNRWSSHQLQSEILAVKVVRNYAGRKPLILSGEHFESELARMLWAWSRKLNLQLDADPKISDERLEDVRLLLKLMTDMYDKLTNRD